MREQVSIYRIQHVSDGAGGFTENKVLVKSIVVELEQNTANVQTSTGQWIKSSGWYCEVYYSPTSFIVENDIVEFDTYTMKVTSVLNFNKGRRKKQKLIFAGDGK